MPKYNYFNFDKYANRIEKQIKSDAMKIVREKVAPAAKQEMLDVIDKEMYKTYSPAVYQRRKKNNGLLDPDNVVVNVKKTFDNACGVKIKNIAKRQVIKVRDNPYGQRPKALYKEVNSRGKSIGIAEDLLYYWKDQGLVYNYFHTESYKCWGRAMHFNDKIRKNFIDSGEAQKIIYKSFKEKYKTK